MKCFPSKGLAGQSKESLANRLISHPGGTVRWRIVNRWGVSRTLSTPSASVYTTYRCSGLIDHVEMSTDTTHHLT